MSTLNKDEEKFVDDLINNRKVYLYTRKSDDTEIYTDINLLDINNIQKYSIEELQNFLSSDKLYKFTKKLSGAMSHHKNETLDTYMSALSKYKKAIQNYINGSKYVLPDVNKGKDTNNGNDDNDGNDENNVEDKIKKNEIDTVEGQGVKKRNGYKIKNSKYNDKLKINMDKLYNNYYVEAWYGDNILYENQGDKDTVELLTKSRVNKKKKYSKLSQEIFNDMITLSGMIKQRNGKIKMLGESNIILNENDLRKRIALLRGTIIAGKDNKKLQNELPKLTNQDNVIQNKSVNDLYNNLKTLTPMLKGSKGDENVHNQVYNIIDYLRSNRHISRDQYHKYIKKHLM